jgi:hypothetical protein
MEDFFLSPDLFDEPHTRGILTAVGVSERIVKGL